MLVVWVQTAGLAQDSPGVNGPPMLSSIEVVRRLSLAQARAGPKVDLTGVITWLDVRNSGFVLADDASATWVEGPLPGGLRVGSRVRVVGRVVEGYFTVSVRGDSVELLGTGQLPEFRNVPPREQLQGQWDLFRVAATGSLFNRPNVDGQVGLVLLSDGVPIWLAGPDPAPQFPSGTVFAEAAGISSLGVRERQIIDCRLLLDSWDQLKLIRTNLVAPAGVTKSW